MRVRAATGPSRRAISTQETREHASIGAMKGTLTQNGDVAAATPDAIQAAVAGGSFFWLDLDLHDPGPDDDVTGMLTDTFHFHPVAVEAAAQFGQRARIDDYDDFVHVVTFGMSGDGKNVVEMHCFTTEKCI